MNRISVRNEDEMRPMALSVRCSFAAVGLGLVALMFGFGFRKEWATRLWVWDDHRMNFIFLASIAAAVAAPALWVAFTGEYVAWSGVAINGVVVGTLASCYLLSRVLRDLEPGAGATALVFVALTPLAALSFRLTHSSPVLDRRPMPRFVRAWFVSFAALLITVGTALLLQIDNVFPWTLDSPVSTLFGCFFLGASAYFMYALRRGLWVIAAGALWSFLAYDIVLLIPYANMFREESTAPGAPGMYGSRGAGTGDEVNELSLAIYLLALGVSAIVAMYALLINPETRVWARAARSSMAGSAADSAPGVS